MEKIKRVSEDMYSVDGSEPVPFRILSRWAIKRGYDGGAGPFHIAEWLRMHGKELHEVRGNKKYLVG